MARHSPSLQFKILQQQRGRTVGVTQGEYIGISLPQMSSESHGWLHWMVAEDTTNSILVFPWASLTALLKFVSPHFVSCSWHTICVRLSFWNALSDGLYVGHASYWISKEALYEGWRKLHVLKKPSPVFCRCGPRNVNESVAVEKQHGNIFTHQYLFRDFCGWVGRRGFWQSCVKAGLLLLSICPQAHTKKMTWKDLSFTAALPINESQSDSAVHIFNSTDVHQCLKQKTKTWNSWSLGNANKGLIKLFVTLKCFHISLPYIQKFW